MKINKVKIYDLEESIEANKYPMVINVDDCTSEIIKRTEQLGSSDMGEGHDNFLNGIRVAFNLTCTNKMWVEMERYHFMDFVSSQSTMHKITKLDVKKQCNKYVWLTTINQLEFVIQEYNEMVIAKFSPDEIKEKFLEIIYNIPSGFELTARMTTNYRQLKTIYHQRKSHKLPEWRELCNWIEELPHFKELCLGGK